MNKKIKVFFRILYVILALISVLTLLYLCISPLKRGSQLALYDTENKVYLKEYNSLVKLHVELSEENVFRLMLFLDGSEVYDNLKFTFLNSRNEEVFSKFVEEYQSSIILFEFFPIDQKGNYTLIVEDMDNDFIKLGTTQSNGKAYLIENKSETLQLLTFYYEDAYVFLWYPVFLMVILFLFFPFIWKDDKNA